MSDSLNATVIVSVFVFTISAKPEPDPLEPEPDPLEPDPDELEPDPPRLPAVVPVPDPLPEDELDPDPLEDEPPEPADTASPGVRLESEAIVPPTGA